MLLSIYLPDKFGCCDVSNGRRAIRQTADGVDSHLKITYNAMYFAQINQAKAANLWRMAAIGMPYEETCFPFHAVQWNPDYHCLADTRE